MNTTEKKYVGTYKVYKIFKVSRRKEIIKRNLTRDEAIMLVNLYSSNLASMVVFDKQFKSSKYYK